MGKILANEVASDADAESLLLNARSHSVYLAGMDQRDLTRLAAHLSILSFSVGQRVLQKGQDASWVGIVLSGTLSALVEQQVVGTMAAGAFVGEIAFFTGGVRLADVDGASEGYIATMAHDNLTSLFASSTHTACKLVRALGRSALSQLATNPSVHKPLEWDDGAATAAHSASVEKWAAELLDPDEVEGLEEGDMQTLTSSVRVKTFSAGERVLDRYAKSDALYFVLRGRVGLDLNGARLGQAEAGEPLQDLRFFDGGLFPNDAIGLTDGVLGGIEAEAIESLPPSIAMAMLRKVGSAAVDGVRSGMLERAAVVGGDVAISRAAPRDEGEREAARLDAAGAAAEQLST